MLPSAFFGANPFCNFWTTSFWVSSALFVIDSRRTDAPLPPVAYIALIFVAISGFSSGIVLPAITPSITSSTVRPESVAILITSSSTF